MPTRQALARHPVAIAGAIMATATAVVFIALVIAALFGLFRNPYAGLVVFVALPALFVLGLFLIPLGMWLQRRKLARAPAAGAEDWPVVDFRRPDVRRSALMITALTAVNIVIVLLAGYGGLHWMESPGFCGQVCHTPMHPQFAAWEAGVHRRVACAQCHIGEGASGFVHAKLAGVRQLIHVATNSYPRPIPPGAEMPPGERVEACGRCHEPVRAAGDRVRVNRAYADDEVNTETTTVLQMYVNKSAASTRAIHWHADPAVRVEYVSTDDKNETIPYVKVTDANGQVKEFRAPDTTDEMINAGRRRLMDCADCHNAVGHPIAPTPELAVDQAIAAGRVNRELKYVRREGLRLMKASYSSVDDAVQAIDREMRSFYQSQGTSGDPQAVAKTVAALQDIYRRNVFPDMKVTWGSYPDQKGHFTSNGCFRCHDESHSTKDGATISGDCSYCHDQRQ